ncbi:MAG: O-antigen ligase family protein [Euzebya sp.]
MDIRWSGGFAGVLTALTAVAFWRGSVDVFNTTKGTVLVLGAVIVVAGVVVGWLWSARAELPIGVWPTLAGVLWLTLVVAVWVSPTPLRSFVGVSGRHGGLAVYSAALVMGLATALWVQRDGDRARAGLAAAVSVAGVTVAGYVALQSADLDPFVWTTVEGGAPRFASFGNVDFASAWLGIVAVVLSGAALQSRDSAPTLPWWRIQGLVALGCVGAAVLTGSLQGPVVAAIGVPVVVAAAFRPSRRVVGLIGVGVIVVGGALALGPGRSAVEGAGRSLETRVPKWQAAVGMGAQSPLTGRGLDTYGDWYYAFRPPELAARTGLTRSVDNAHNVALHLFSGGGALLLMAWLAVMVVAPGVAVWRQRRQLWTSPARVGMVMGWVGYLVQAQVSLDVPPLMVLGVVLTGAVAADVGLVELRRMVLPGPASVRIVLAGVVVVSGVAVMGPFSRAWRADTTGWTAEVARAQAAPLPAEEATFQAMVLAPWESRYAAAHGAWLTNAGDARRALDYQAESLRREPRSLAHALNVARLLTALGDSQGAAEVYDRVAQIDPYTPAVQQEVAAGGQFPDQADPAEGPVLSPP